MAVMNSTQRTDAARKLIQRMFVEANQTANLTVPEVIDMIGGLDNFIDSNAAAINQAIPVGVRNKATLEQKALAIAYVVMKRGGVI